MTPVPLQSSTFGAFGPPVIDGAIVAFVALKQPFGYGGIYASEGEALTPIADINTPAPGDQGNLAAFDTPALAGGNVAFLGADSTGTQGIYARIDGTLRKVISTTDTLDGKVVSYFEFVTSTACDFSGCPRGFGTGFDGSRLAFLATFPDGSQGIYLAKLVSTRFAVLDARVEIEGDELELESTFRLGAGNDGIAPLTEVVSLQVGSFSTTIPASSFQAAGKGRFRFAAVIDGVRLNVAIRSRRAGEFQLTAKADGVEPAGTVNPVSVSITVGDDTGSTTVTAEFGHDHDDEDDENDDGDDHREQGDDN